MEILSASLERWCKLRGNLLFYMKTKDQFSEPVGVVVLLHNTIRVDHSFLDGTYGFFLGKESLCSTFVRIIFKKFNIRLLNGDILYVKPTIINMSKFTILKFAFILLSLFKISYE